MDKIKEIFNNEIYYNEKTVVTQGKLDSLQINLKETAKNQKLIRDAMLGQINHEQSVELQKLYNNKRI